MSLSNRAIHTHDESDFAGLASRETPRGRETTRGTAAVRDGLHLVVIVEEPPGSQLLEVEVGGATAVTPGPARGPGHRFVMSWRVLSAVVVLSFVPSPAAVAEVRPVAEADG